MTPQQAELTGSSQSAFAIYRKMAVGKSSIGFFAGYELSQLLLSNLPGILGLGGRSLVYPKLFRSCGKTPAIGRGVILRNPGAVSIGKKFLLDDYATLDARGDSTEIVIDDYVSIGRLTSIVAKNASVHLGNAVNIGSYCRIATQSKIEIGESTLVAAYCYIGPGNHQQGEGDTPLISREMEIKGGVKIGRNVWIGAGALIMDGVTIGDGAVIGAQSLVKDDVPAGAVVVGTPARVVACPRE